MARAPACIRRPRRERGREWSRHRGGPADRGTDFECPARENTLARVRASIRRRAAETVLRWIRSAPLARRRRTAPGCWPRAAARAPDRPRTCRPAPGRQDRSLRGRRKSAPTDPGAGPGRRRRARLRAARTSWPSRRAGAPSRSRRFPATDRLRGLRTSPAPDLPGDRSRSSAARRGRHEFARRLRRRCRTRCCRPCLPGSP